MRRPQNRPSDAGTTTATKRYSLTSVGSVSLVTVASTFWDVGSLSLKSLRRPLCQLLAATIRDCLDVALQRESYERCLGDGGSSDQLEDPEEC